MRVKKSCKDCGFYEDCPIDYECPALELLNEIRKREGAIFTVNDGKIIGLITIEEGEDE